jgi:Ca-activated chloride channel family protein
VLGAAGANAQAQADRDPFVGTLMMHAEDGVRQPAVALATDVEIFVSGLVARAQVSQRFQNHSDLWVEGVYVFPLPEMAAVDRMVLEVGERRIEGQIQERAQAKRTYQKARREGRKASLVEQERPNLFTASVANIGPGEFVDVHIEYQQTLDYEDGGFELRFPMTLTSRYVPGLGEPDDDSSMLQHFTPADGSGRSPGTLAVPDAACVTRPMLHPDSPVQNPLSLRVELDVGFPLERLESPSYPVVTRALDTHLYEVWLDDVPADRDFVLRWAPERGKEPRAAIFSEERDGEHFALLMLLPPEDDSSQAQLPREAIFVIDTSGSMAGTSIGQAREALHLALDRLSPEDTYNVIAFDSTPRPLFDGPEPATPRSLREAHRFVAGLEAAGGTEMLPALELALRESGDPAGRLRQVVFITDGSIGNETELFAAIQRDLGATRLFMVGIGSAPNAYLLNRAASFGRGTVTLIGSQDEVGEGMAALFRKIERPVLSDLEVRWNDAVEMWPQRVPDLYAGEPVLVVARLDRFVGEVRLLGRRGGAPLDLRLPLTPGAHETGVHKLWARRKIAHWMGQASLGVAAETIREQVLEVALDHELVSKFTSLVAVDVTPTRPLGAPGSRSTVPNHGPAGFDANLVPGVLPQGATPAPLLFGIGIVALAVAAGGWRSARSRS